LYFLVQAGAFTLTVAHFFFQIIAFPTGDSFEILGGVAKISVSIDHIILYSTFSCSFPSIISTNFTSDPIFTLLWSASSSSISFTNFKSASICLILTSI
jgi:hypothetical protein